MAVPKLRFKDENGADYPEWEKKKFKNVFSYIANNTLSRDGLTYDKTNVKNIHYGDILTVYGSTLNVDDNNIKIPYINTNIDLDNISDISYLVSGDIIIADTAEDYTVGKATEIINHSKSKILSGLHTMACRPSMNFAEGFIGAYINSNAFHNQLYKLAQGTKVLSINKKNTNDTIISIPNREEQQKIADFLTTFDKRITAQQNIIADMEEIKKGLLQKIFSQEIRLKDNKGENYPAWKEKSLEETISLIVDNRGKTPPISEDGYPLIEINAVGGYIVNYKEITKFVSEEIYRNWFRKHLLKGDILFSTVGNTALCSFYDDKIKSCVAQNIIGMRFFNEYDSRFMLYLIKAKQKYIKSIQMNGVQPSIKVTQLIKLKFQLPCLEEQNKIASFLSTYDKKIEAEKKILADLQDLKKGLLQQMFV